MQAVHFHSIIDVLRFKLGLGSHHPWVESSLVQVRRGHARGRQLETNVAASQVTVTTCNTKFEMPFRNSLQWLCDTEQAIVFIHDAGVGWLELSTRRIEITGSSPTIIIDSSSCRSSSCRALTCWISSRIKCRGTRRGSSSSSIKSI